ncbi:MAG TPA: RHS repeat-associated core domain-containing protein, partial [Nitrospira sp.]
LARLTAGDFQDLHYSYDLVGNITGLSNQVPIPAANSFGGPVDQTFAYDGLYRLTQAAGEWRFSPNKRQDYALSLGYDTIHNITRKTQSDSVTTPGGSTVPQKLTTYDFAYAYAGHGPHQSTTIDDRAFSYDANGNQTGWDALTSGQRRTIVWDDENRAHQISDNGQTTAFVYDDSGQRVIKRGKQGETAYINQFWTVRNRSVGTKHIFVGDTRIASKVIPGDAHIDPGSKDPFTSVLGQWWQKRSEQGWQNGNNTVKNPHFAGNRMPDILPEDNFVYFYHPDHLGSTSFATAATGDLFEHMEYFPFGETWVSEQTNTQRLPNLFTSKELDEETQLYYFGARYYDPRTSVWQSADPMLGKYLPRGDSAGDAKLPGMGGVFNSRNMAMYAYGALNPLVFKDPNGMWNVIIGGAGDCAAAKCTIGTSLVYGAKNNILDMTSKVLGERLSETTLFFRDPETTQIRRDDNTKMDSSALRRVRDFIKEHQELKEEPIDLFGHSYGGADAMLFWHELTKAGFNVRSVNLFDPVSRLSDQTKPADSNARLNIFVPSKRDRSTFADIVSLLGGEWVKQQHANYYEIEPNDPSGHAGVLYPKPGSSIWSIGPGEWRFLVGPAGSP